MSQLRVGVVGVGALGRHHARILAGFHDVDLVGVVDPRADVGEGVAAAHQSRWFDDYRHLLGRVDAVSIVVPTVAHEEVASAFLSRGIPTLVEKPLANSVPSGRQIVEAAERSGAVLQVGHVERFNPTWGAARKQSGPPKYIRSERLSPYAFRSMDIGAVHDLMIHDLDLVLDLADSPIRHVEAFGVCLFGGHEDMVQARLHFENGCIADLTANRISPRVSRGMQIWSHTGCVSADFQSREVVGYHPSEAMIFGTPVSERARQPGADIDQLKRDVFGSFVEVDVTDVCDDDALTAELSHFLQCARTGEQPLVSGTEGLRALEAAELVLQSVESHQWDGHAGGAIGPFARVPAQHRKAG